MKFFTEQRKLSILHRGQELVVPGSPLSQIAFAPLSQPLDRRALAELEARLGIRYPQAVIDFLELCGGYEASTDHVYPSALGKRYLPVGIELNCPGNHGFFNLNCFQLPEADPFYVVAQALGNDYVRRHEPRLRKLVPLAWDNGRLLCLDFSASAVEPRMALVEPDMPAVHRLADSFIEFVLSIGYRQE